ncbi:MAG: hypothetical protein CVT48_00790 [Thermoplasmata archaeon HGW-Thermoplasmata-1]|nr:MAG: hypothetical protein CVT48_00790 [Thermoplasmata archaeon HGW-Thermoplasmata-1]
MEFKFDRKANFRERPAFTRRYAAWVKSVPNEVWSKEQAKLINSFMESAKNFALSKEQYLEMVGRERR